MGMVEGDVHLGRASPEAMPAVRGVMASPPAGGFGLPPSEV